MSTTKTKIANAAMALLGQTRFSDVDTDTSEQAKWIRDLWDNSRDETIRAHPWNWATRRTTLNSEPGEQSNPKMQAIHGLMWASELSLWVGVGAADAARPYVITSPDKITWTQHTTGLSKAFDLNGIAFDGTTLVAVGSADGSDAYIVTSTDGISWAEQSNDKNKTLLRVVWAGGISLFIAVGVLDGTDAYIVTSPDGTTWTEQTNPKNFSLFDIVWTGSVAVAVGGADGTDAYLITSPDGITWEERTNPKNVVLRGIAWSGKRLIAVGLSTGTAPYTITSDDGGATWTERSNVPKALTLLDISFGNGFFVAVGVADTVDNDDTFVVSSIDGESWAERYLGKNVTLFSIAFGDTNFMMGGDPDGKDAYLLSWAGPPAYGLTFSYQLPSGNLRVWDVNDGRDKDYKLEEGAVLTRSINGVDIRYTRQITDVAKFDALFARALSVQLAKDLAIAINASDTRMEKLEKEWQRAIGQARTTDSQEDGEDRRRENPWTAARFVGNSHRL